MGKLRLGYDDNLGLPTDFTTKVDCEIIPHHDIGVLIDAFENNELDAIFIPVGTLPYIQKYHLAAQSVFTTKKKLTLQSNFVSTKTLTIANIPQNTLGCVNQYCTTSYWAPMIYLTNSLPKGTTLTYKYTKGFFDLLHCTAQKEVDCAMVWDIILQEKPEDKDKVTELFFLANLPTPVIIVKPGISLPDNLFTFSSNDKTAFFTGFKTPEVENVKNFLRSVSLAQEHFKVITT